MNRRYGAYLMKSVLDEQTSNGEKLLKLRTIEFGMEKVLDTVEKVKEYALSVGFELSNREAQLFKDYLVDCGYWSLELREDEQLYRVDLEDTLGYFEAEVITFGDMLEMVTKANTEFLANAFDICAETETKDAFDALEKCISDKDTISALWKRLYRKICVA